MTHIIWFFFKRNNPWEWGEEAHTEVWVWWGRMGGGCENKRGEEEKYGRGRPTSGVSDISQRLDSPMGGPWNNSTLGSDSRAIGGQLLHILTHAQTFAWKGRSGSTHRANELLLKTCITPRRLPTTHVVAAACSRGVTTSQLCTNGSCIAHHVTTNDTEQCRDYVGSLGYQPSSLGGLQPLPHPLKGLGAKDDWQVPSSLSGNIHYDLYPAEPTHMIE